MPEEKKGLTGALSDQLKGATRGTIEALAMKMGVLPSERAWVAVDIGASLAAISLKATVDFFKAAPEVARLLENGDLRNWAELGRRIALNNAEEASEFFRSSADTLGALPVRVRPLLVNLCARQIVLSPASALATFRSAPQTISAITDEAAAVRLFGIAVEVAHRSVKHSTEVLNAAPRALAVARALEQTLRLDPHPQAKRPLDQILDLASQFAERTGATAAEFLSAVGDGLEFISERAEIDALCSATSAYLERGGATALQFFRSARVVMELGGRTSFEKWSRVARNVANEGNAIVYDFLKLTPRVCAALAATRLRRREADRRHEVIGSVLDVIEELTTSNIYIALECFKSSPRALAVASLEQFQSWARSGAMLHPQDRRRATAYFALESRTSQESLRGANDGVTLESIAHLLRLYVEALTGREMLIAPIGSIPDESRIGDGHTIYLPSVVAEFGSTEEDFRLYKALAAHAAGQIEFGTREIATPDIRAAISEIDAFFIEKAREVDSRNDPEFAIHSEQHYLRARQLRPLAAEELEAADYRTALGRFANIGLATRIFTTLENGRIDHRLRQAYRGIRRDLDFVRKRIIEHRPPVMELPVEQAIYELLFQITICGGVVDDKGRWAYAEIIRAFENIIADYLRRDASSVGDTLIATLKVYSLIGEQKQQKDAEQEASQQEQEADEEQSENDEGESRQQKRAAQQQRASDPFTQWSQSVEETLPSDSEMLNELMNAESSEQELQEGDLAFFYDEWDRELGDHRAKWCRVIQRENRRGPRDFVEGVRARYSGIISSIRHQFQMLKPESLRRVKGELDGEDFDLEAVIDHHVDKRSTGRASDRLYVRRIRREREVAVSFLLDMSSSTARTITRHPNQPYTRPGQKIIDIEKQGLVLMSEALEAVGDSYSISGFTSEGRRNVKYFVVKQFGEKYSPEVERRIGGITYHNNTRLGAAIRHAATELERQDARTKLLIVLSDGRPYDHDYGDSRYAREDTKMALRQAKTNGITPFCITIDRESEAELKDLYGEVGYTIIDDVLSLPERMPGIYRRLTT
ncbi:MAG: VWA domain-containing protein [Blastocatellales bacterium]|nr:VWA domain-containing protein [Blastocatellales bacterium]